MARTFRGQKIVKETVALGVKGQIHRDEEFPALPNRARVTFSAEAEFSSVKHKFLEKGGVEEIVILAIEASTFTVTDVAEPIEEPQLPLDEPAEAQSA